MYRRCHAMHYVKWPEHLPSAASLAVQVPLPWFNQSAQRPAEENLLFPTARGDEMQGVIQELRFETAL